MTQPAEMLQLLRTRQRNHTLPGRLYNDPDVFQMDMEAIWYRHWLCVGATCEVAQPGQYITLSIGPTPTVVLRDNDGEVRAFFNSCRHRGSRICDARQGTAKTLVCPYHRWTYKLTGALAYASWMPDDFDRSQHALRPIHVRTVAGTIYVCLAEDPPDFDSYAQGLTPLLAPHGLARARVAAEVDMVAAGNWKLVMENSRECYHCATQHKELMHTLLDIYDFKNPADMAEIRTYWDRLERDGLPCPIAEGPDFRANRLPFTNGALSITMDGLPAVSRTMGDVPYQDVGSLRWVHYPSVFNHALGDFAVIIRMLPVGPQTTMVTTKFLVDQDAVEGRDYDLTRLTEVWNTTNEQDKSLIERNQAGVNSIGYVPGPYSPALEAGVIKFVDWYADAMTRHLGGGRLQQVA